MFELPKDDKRRKLWTIRVNRRISFNRIALLSRLCANHFTNELFVVNNLFADFIGHRIKKLVKKPDAAPTLLFFETYRQRRQCGRKWKEKSLRSISSCRKANTKRGNIIQLCVYILFCFTCCDKQNWTFLISQYKYKLVVSFYKRTMFLFTHKM
jgi:hypothetical protein